MRTPESNIFGRALGNALEKGGTKAGAKRGWETKKGRAPVEKPKGEGKQTLGENFLLTPGSGDKFMDGLKGAPIGTEIRDAEGKVNHRKTGDNEWAWHNPATGKIIMTGDDHSVFQSVRTATTGEAPRKLPAWPSTGYGSPGHKGENWTMEIPEDKGKKVETYPAKYRPGGKGWGEVRQVTVPPRDDEPEKAVNMVGGMIEGFLAKEGTSEGAERGWETRRGRAPAEDEGGGARSGGGEEQQRERLPGWGRPVGKPRETDRVIDMRGEVEVGQIVIGQLFNPERMLNQTHFGRVKKVGKKWLDIVDPDGKVVRLTEKIGVYSGEDAAQAERVFRAAEKMGQEEAKKDISKEGNSEGAKRGWETRRGRAPVERQKVDRPRAQPAPSVEGSGKASPETIALMQGGLKTLSRIFDREGYEDEKDAVDRLLAHGLGDTPNTETSLSQEARIKQARGLLEEGMNAAQEAISQSQDGNPPPWYDDINDAVEAYDEEQSGEEAEPPAPVRIPASSVTMDTGKYRANMGKEPKGRGRWAFQIGDKVEFIHGDYGEARREAARMAAERGERGVRVLP